ncbi:MAG TPA: TrmH family RNA methyltransferase, partial [Bacteroidota bacterium]|nr:TrmH family RNA methyltransferase [Bacteroidota bacterium]
VFKLSIVQCERLTSMIQQLQKNNIRVFGAHPRASQTLSNTNFKQDCCLVFGSEGSGLSEGVLESCDESIAITMRQGVDSLNVASASAVFFFEVCRQREGA